MKANLLLFYAKADGVVDGATQLVFAEPLEGEDGREEEDEDGEEGGEESGHAVQIVDPARVVKVQPLQQIFLENPKR